MTVAAEGNGTTFFFGNRFPGGVGGGARIDQPIIWGFGLGAGYQMVYLFSAVFPWNVHHAYGALFYRIDDLPLIVPQIEGGLGAVIFVDRGTGQTDTQALAHFGGSLDFLLPAHLFVGMFLRYNVFFSTGEIPGALSAGLRVGFNVWESL